MPKFEEYPAKTAPSNSDILVIKDVAAGNTKHITRGNLLAGSPMPNNTVTTAAITDGAVTSAKLNYSSLPFEGAAGLSTTNTATTYGNLSTSAAVTIDVPSTGNIALIFSARLFNTTTSDQTGYVTYVASGANTIAASDANAIAYKILSGNSDASYARVKYLTGLTPGSTTFTLQRRTTGGSLQVINADIVAIPMS